MALDAEKVAEWKADALTALRCADADRGYRTAQQEAGARTLALLAEVERLTVERGAAQAMIDRLTREREAETDNYLNAANARLAAESSAARLREVLRGVEWEGAGDGYSACPVCAGMEPLPGDTGPMFGHAEGCALAAALK